MANLTSKILQIYPDLTFEDFKNYIQVNVNDDGTQEIVSWTHPNYNQPSESELEAVNESANEYEANLITNKENNKASAKQKLQDLGLTVDEIKEAFGI